MDMNNRVLFCLLLLLQSNTTLAPQQGTAPTSTQQPPTAACKQPCLEDGTPVKLRMSQTVSSADAHVNDRVEFEVLEDIKVTDVIVVPKGGIPGEHLQPSCPECWWRPQKMGMRKT